jgi:uncharacterized damage-inducible protein DinB
MTSEYVQKLAAHDAWANGEFISAMEKLPDPPARALELIAHILSAQWVWLTRMERRPQPMKVWPVLSLVDCRTELAKLEEGWKKFLASVDLNATFPYTNSKGEHFESRVGDTLTHVFLHGQYHRGQIALLMRQTGVTPPYTDFIEAVRKAHI